MINKKLKILIIVSIIIVFISIACLLVLQYINKTEEKNKATDVAVQPIEKIEEKREISKLNSDILLLEASVRIDEINEAKIKADENKKKEEEEKKKKEQEENTDTRNVKYYIKVNYQANVVTIYTVGEQGELNPYKAMICSTGSATPHSGVYTIPSGYRAKGTWGLMVGNVYAQYYTRIVGSILFHSVPYTKMDKSSLEYWEYDKLGTTASAGCVRLTVQDAKWIYNNCPSGTQVEFYADSNPGPLGKPSARKISNEDEELRNWDPTDSDSSNPWKNHKEEKITNQTTNKTESTKKDETENKNSTNNKKNSSSKNNENISKDSENKNNDNDNINKNNDEIVKDDVSKEKDETEKENNNDSNPDKENQTIDDKQENENTDEENDTGNDQNKDKEALL